jgi:16S rRNA (adenine1518-N6/adenine1519-N6)-dimethyltransferase
MQTLAEIKAILDAGGMKPRKFLGQNFLIDHNLLRKLVDSANLTPGEVVLEVGPGTGTMTEEILSRGVKLIACELDHGLAAMLRQRFAGEPRFTLIEGDCLEGKRGLNASMLEAIGEGPFKLVSNLPYGSGTPLISQLLVHVPRCASMCVTIQKEVAERLAADAGSEEYGPLGVVAGATARVETVAKLPPECFWPRPDVTSAMIRIERRDTPLFEDVPRLSAACAVIFAQRRKQLGSMLSGKAADAGQPGVSWPEGVVPSLRAEQLRVEQVIELVVRNPWLGAQPETGG